MCIKGLPEKDACAARLSFHARLLFPGAPTTCSKNNNNIHNPSDDKERCGDGGASAALACVD